jgi:hypothetical protein
MAQHPVIATGIGSWPGTDMNQALKITLAESAELPYLPELPARGAGAGLAGRGVAMLSGLSADLQPAGWRLTSGPGHDQRRARALLRDDLDRLEEAAVGYEGPFKFAIAGPWTLAGSVERPRGGRVLGDDGARRDLAQSLAAGTADLLTELRRRLAGLQLIVQLDEPLLPAVAAGRLATVSGYSAHRPVEPPELSAAIAEMTQTLNTALDVQTAQPSGTAADHPVVGMPVRTAADRDRAAATPLDPRFEDDCTTVLPRIWVHCCAPGLPWQSLVDAGIGGVLVDLDQLGTADLDVVGQLISDGLWLGAGALNTSDSGRSQRGFCGNAVAQRILRLISDLGLDPDTAAQMVVTPACGLAGFDERSAVTALRTVGKAADIVTEELGN